MEDDGRDKRIVRSQTVCSRLRCNNVMRVLLRNEVNDLARPDVTGKCVNMPGLAKDEAATGEENPASLYIWVTHLGVNPMPRSMTGCCALPA